MFNSEFFGIPKGLFFKKSPLVGLGATPQLLCNSKQAIDSDLKAAREADQKRDVGGTKPSFPLGNGLGGDTKLTCQLALGHAVALAQKAYAHADGLRDGERRCLIGHFSLSLSVALR